MSATTTRHPGSDRSTVFDSRLVRAALPLGFVVLLIVAWEVAYRSNWVNPVIVPSPLDVGEAMVDLVQQAYFWTAVKVTLLETVYGFALGVVVGIALGAMIGTFSWFRMVFYPLIVAFQNMPRVALAPIFLTWFGFGLTSKVVMAATIAFFPVVINTVVGLESIARNERLFMRSLGVSKVQMFGHLTLPSAASNIFAGLKTAMTLALLGAIVAEFVGASEGMGVLMYKFNFELNIAYAFAVLFFLAGMGLVMYVVIEVIDRKVIFWRER